MNLPYVTLTAYYIMKGVVLPSRKKKQSRIQKENRTLILEAALHVFSQDGFLGATLDRIAEHAGMSKTNMLYYYRSKDDIYQAVLEQTLEVWLGAFVEINPDGDPIEELRRYITLKLEMSARHPEVSRLFANEIRRGAPFIKGLLETRLKQLVDKKASFIRNWVEQEKLAPVDPYHLVFVIWACTQQYADFEAQTEAIIGAKSQKTAFCDSFSHSVLSILLHGIRPR